MFLGLVVVIFLYVVAFALMVVICSRPEGDIKRCHWFKEIEKEMQYESPRFERVEMFDFRPDENHRDTNCHGCAA